jgi:type I restriction enzyme S subunit
MTQWHSRQIGSLGRVVTGKTPPTKEAHYFDGDDLFVSPKDMDWHQQYVTQTQTRVSAKALEKFRNQVIPKNSIMFTSLSFGFGKIGIASGPSLTNQQISSVVVNNENDFRFTYYLLKACTPHIFSYNSGIDTPIVPKSVFERIELRVPGPDLQKKIAAVLWAYDELIENNKRRIALLEKMAEEIYREWFVRFRFPGHEEVKVIKGVPEGWEQKGLTELAEITYGFPFDGSRFSPDERGRPIIRIRNIPDSSTSDFTDEVADEKYVVRHGDLLVGMDGEFHINHWHAEDAYLVQRVCRIKPKNPLLEAYLAHAVRAPIKHFESILMGATVGHLGAMHLRSVMLLVPPESLLPKLQVLNDIHVQKLTIVKACRLLSRTRDSLLPRLISGKLSVERLDIRFPPSMLETTRSSIPIGGAKK